MKVKIEIQPDRVKYKRNDTLQIDFHLPDFSELGEQRVWVNYPLTLQKVKDVIRAKVIMLKADFEKTLAARSLLGTDILNFEVDI